jgi:hypothetical protein
MLGNRWPHKPPIGYEIDVEHPLSRGLVFFAPLWEGAGKTTFDIVSGTTLSLANNAVWGTGSQIVMNAVSVGSAQTVAPPSLQLPGPMTIAVGWHYASQQSNQGGLFGLSYANSNSSPYYAAGFRLGGSYTQYNLYHDIGGPLRTLTSTAAIATGNDYVTSASLASGLQTVYTNGVPSGSNAYAGSITYGTNPYLYIGNCSTVYGNYATGAIFYWAAIWARTLSASEHAAIAQNVWQIYEPRRLQTYYGPIAALGAPSSIRLIVTEAPPPESGTAIAIHGSALAPVVATTIVLTASEAPQPYSGMILVESGQTAAIPRFDSPAVVASAGAESPRAESGGVLAGCTPQQAGAVPTPPGRMVTIEAPAPSPGSVLSSADRLLAAPPFNPRAMTVIAAAEPQPSYPGSVLDGRRSELLVGSGYHVYSNTGSGDPINYATSVATTLISDTTWTSTALAAPGAWKFGVRAFDSNGEEQNLDCAVTIVLDAFGNDITNQPLPPTGLRAFAMPGGSIRVEWYYPLTRGPTVPIGFNIYLGIGDAPNYTTPAATVLYSAGLFNVFVANIAGLSDGTTYAVGVRAYNGSGAEQNTIAVSVTADAIGPAAVDSLFATAIV